MAYEGHEGGGDDEHAGGDRGEVELHAVRAVRVLEVVDEGDEDLRRGQRWWR